MACDNDVDNSSDVSMDGSRVSRAARVARYRLNHASLDGEEDIPFLASINLKINYHFASGPIKMAQ